VASCGGTTKGSEEAQGDGGGTAREADPNAEIKEGLKIAFLPKEIDNPYEVLVDEGGIDAVTELKGEG
jgi:rhamnose transport system substrate-binding protein